MDELTTHLRAKFATTWWLAFHCDAAAPAHAPVSRRLAVLSVPQSRFPPAADLLFAWTPEELRDLYLEAIAGAG